MADFAAVLRKTIATLKENTPEARERIYQKARSTIDAKLKALNPPPTPEVVARQMKVLEDAIAMMEAEFASPATAKDPLNGLDEVLRDLETLSKSPSTARWSPSEKPVQAPVIAPSAPVSADAVPASEPSQPETPDPVAKHTESAAAEAPPAEEAAGHVTVESEPEEDSAEPVAEPEEASSEPEAKEEGQSGESPHAESGEHEPASESRPALVDPVLDALDERPALRELREKKAKKSFRTPLVAVAVVLLACAVAGAAWLFRDDLTELVGSGSDAEVATDTATPAGADSASSQAGSTPADTQQEQAAASPQPVRKLTQRLLPDGSEVDEGPGSGYPTVGEGTSVAAATDLASARPSEPQQTNSSQPAVAVGQKAIFYEERTIQEQASASDGSVVWRIEHESPGADLPPEPVIYAEATIPAKRIRLKMSIRRNVDQSLPASYIAELIFLTPEDFPGGAVGGVASVSLKRTEQDAGNRLLGIPAKISDGFFLVALSDNKADVEANNLLLSRMEWIDIPIVYTSGRRALITLEKGVPGSNVFNEALNAWKQAMSG